MVWSDYSATVCRPFEVSSTSSVVQSQVQICATTTEVQNPLLHLMPHIIIWAPGEQFPHLFPNGLKCPKCHKENTDESSHVVLGGGMGEGQLIQTQKDSDSWNWTGSI